MSALLACDKLFVVLWRVKQRATSGAEKQGT